MGTDLTVRCFLDTSELEDLSKWRTKDVPEFEEYKKGTLHTDPPNIKIATSDDITGWIGGPTTPTRQIKIGDECYVEKHLLDCDKNDATRPCDLNNHLIWNDIISDFGL